MDAIRVDPDVLGGTPCFSGTRVPVSSLFDHLSRGYAIDYFVSQFPTVNRQQVQQVLAEAVKKVSTTPPRRAA